MVNTVYPYNGILFDIKGNEMWICTAIWMNSENYMLDRKSQIQRTTYCRIPVYEILNTGKSIEMESGALVTRGGEGPSLKRNEV